LVFFIQLTESEESFWKFILSKETFVIMNVTINSKKVQRYLINNTNTKFSGT
jgi:hypothetical protein